MAEQFRDLFIRVPPLKRGAVGDDMPPQLHEIAFADEIAPARVERGGFGGFSCSVA